MVTGIQRPGAERQFASIREDALAKGTFSKSSNGFVTPKRPASARERGRTGTVTPGPYSNHSQQRSRSRERTMSEGRDPVKNTRSRSVGASELGRQLTNRPALFGTVNGKSPEVLIVSRDGSGQHSVTPLSNGTKGANGNNNFRNGDEFKRPVTPRVQITPDRILPDKPKLLNRSPSAESSDSGSNGTCNNSLNGGVSVPKTADRSPRVSKTSRSLSFSSTLDDDDGLEPPPENKALNEKMERLFQEYLKLELGTNGEDSKYTFAPDGRGRKASDSSEGSGSISSYNSYSNKSGSSFQKSCSSSREDILASASTSGRSSPAIGGGSPRKMPFSQNAFAPTHSTKKQSQNMPGTPRSARRNAREDVNANRPSTPVGGRSGSVSRGSSRPSSAASNRSCDTSQSRKGSVGGDANSNRKTNGVRGRSSSRENLLDSGKPGDRNKPSVRTNPTSERNCSPVSTDRERGRTPTRVSDVRERGRAPTRTDCRNVERGRTPTRTNNVATNRTPTRERGHTPTRPVQNEPRDRGVYASTPHKVRSRSQDILGDGDVNSRPCSTTTRTTTVKNNEGHPKTPPKTRPKPATPARPASARAVPYQQRRRSREDLLDSGFRTPQAAVKSSTPARPASARANPYQPRSRSREDLLDGDSQAERGRQRKVTNSSRQRSASTNVIHRNALLVNQDKGDTAGSTYPGQLDLDLTHIESRIAAKPRKDEKPGRTKIPMPNHHMFARADSPAPLKRYDSGVDIATISPTESSIHGDEMWQHEILASKLAAQERVSAQPVVPYNGFCIDDDDDSEYF